MTDNGLAAVVANCHRLCSLNLGCMPSVSACGVSALCDALPIRDLELGGCTAIREAELVSLFGRFMELDDDESGLSKVQG